MSATPRCAPATRRRMVRWWLGFPGDGRSVAQAPGNCGPIPPGGELIPLAFPDLRMSVERLVEGELVAYLGEELQRAGRSLAKYPHALGYPPLREWLAARLAATRGFSVDADAILLGSGSNEANYLVDLPPAIRSLDDSGRTTIYVASFSKNIAPGMRLGYVTAPPALMERIAAIKGTGGVSELTAMAVYRFAQTGLDAHIERARAWLQAKRDAMLAALETHLGDRALWTRPLGGLFLFVHMLDGTDTVAAAECAAARGVLFAPGTHTAADGVSGRDRMRLCYGWNRPDEMAAGIAELAAALHPEPALASR